MILTETASTPKITSAEKTEYIVKNAKESPFVIYGMSDGYYRIGDEQVRNLNAEISYLTEYTAGGRIRFRTDSDRLLVRIKNQWSYNIETAAGRFDVYVTDENGKTFFSNIMSVTQVDRDEHKNYAEAGAFIARNGHGMLDVTVNFPICLGIEDLFIGLREGCRLEAPTPYRYRTPIVFYGSSIVHGIGASRPGMAYPSIIGRRFDSDYINLGFAGNAKAEPEMMEYISKLNMSVFVYDYDHNSPNIEHLKATHRRGYEIFRKNQPYTPVIMASKVDFYPNDTASAARRQVIKESYEKGLDDGDTNLYFIDGETVFGEEYADASHDGCHPNDYGFILMANAFGRIIKNLLQA